jgi:hypothetical protein
MEVLNFFGEGVEEVHFILLVSVYHEVFNILRVKNALLNAV